MRKKLLQTLAQCALSTALLLMATDKAAAAVVEMGTGAVSVFGHYSGGTTIVWALSSATVNFPAGCTYIMVTRATMGADDYKIAVATMLAARITNKKMRFVAHAERDGGCGVDFVQMVD